MQSLLLCIRSVHVSWFEIDMFIALVYHYLAKIAYCFSFILSTTVNYGPKYHHKSIPYAFLGCIGCFQRFNCNYCNRYTFILKEFPSIHQKSFLLGYQMIAETLTFT